MLKKVGLFLIIIALLLAGCSPALGGSTASQSEAPMAPSTGNSYNSDKGVMGAPAGGSTGTTADENLTGADGSQRLVIQNANLTIQVGAPGDAMSAIRRMAEGMGGFVVASNLYKTYAGEGGELPEATITVRVPASQLNAALDQIKALTQDPSVDVKAETISGQDVTKEYTDLRSRLKNLEDTEAQLREIMASASKTEDVLSVYRELTSIREQIEVIKGQIQYYEEAAAMSAISVLIQAKSSAQPIEVGGWQPAGVAREAIQALVKALQVLANIAITFVLFILPLGLLIAAPFVIIWLIVRRSRKNRKQAA